MEYKIIGQTVPVVELKLNAGETVYTQSGGMAYQTEGIQMHTNARGGIMKSLGRMFTGESIFMANFTSQIDGATIAFASTVPGSIMPVDLRQMPNGLMIQKGAFLCAEDSVETSVAFQSSVSYEIEMVKGLGNIFLGGEGLFLTRLVGPGKIILQSQNFGDFAQKLIPFMPSSSNTH